MWKHNLADWPHFKRDNEALKRVLSSLHAKIEQLHPNQFNKDIRSIEGFGKEAELHFLTETTVRSSFIEGIDLPVGEVRSLISQKLAGKGNRSPVKDWQGFVDVVLDANLNFDLPLLRERLWEWHDNMFPTGYSGEFKILTGTWRVSASDPMVIASVTDDGDTVHYVAPEAVELLSMMLDFMKWLTESELDPFVKSGVAHLWFELLHPFEDGKGRIGRAICDYLLARAFPDKLPFHGLSYQIAKERSDYYHQLDIAARKLSMDITEWLQWFLECLDRSMIHMEHIEPVIDDNTRISAWVNSKGINKRQGQAVRHMLSSEFDGRATINRAGYEKIGNCTNPTMASMDLKDLKDRGIIVQNPGDGRSTSYRLKTWTEISRGF